MTSCRSAKQSCGGLRRKPQPARVGGGMPVPPTLTAEGAEGVRPSGALINAPVWNYA